MTRFLAVLLCFLTVFSPHAQAQQALDVRAGVHDDYSRLVFDWSADANYTLAKNSDREIVMTFDKAATVSAKPVDGTIEGFTVLATDPLKVAILIPVGARTRDFKIGSRVILDVYNPEGAPPATAQAPKPAPVPVAPPKQQEVAKATPPKTPVKPAAKPVPEKPAQKAAEKPAQEKPAETKITEVETPEPAITTPAQPAVAIAPHVITITSTKSLGMTVFEEAGTLWMLTDYDEYYIKPQINGPKPELFAGFQEVEIEGGQLYGTRIPEGGLVAPQGGGLLWRLNVSSKPNTKKPSEPKRMNEAGKASLFFPFKEAHKIMTIKDPVTGQPLSVVTTENSGDFTGEARSFVDFDLLKTYVGLVVRPKVDDLKVDIAKDGIMISRPNGLSVMPEEQLSMARDSGAEEKPDEVVSASAQGTLPGRRIFSFPEWQMGGMSALMQNEMVLLGGLHDKADGQKYEDLITLAKMYISNARGAEALGYLQYALADLPGLDSNPDFLALRGVAYDLSGDPESAFRDLSIADLAPFPEIQYWRAYALANLGDWQQAHEILPKNFTPVYDYPEPLRYILALVLAEIELRAANLEKAEELLKNAAMFEKNMPLPYKSALEYLEGEMARQRGDKDKAKEYWKPLSEGVDDLYRTKAGLALTRLEFENGDIDTKTAIDKLERLRYAWRGDELEAAVNYWLGRVYFDSGEYVKGIGIMRDAATYAPGTELGKRISVEMRQAYENLFLGDNLKKVSAIDAVTLYEEFSELMPAGEAGEKIVQKLSDHMVNADLLERGGDLLLRQLDAGKLKPADTVTISLRLAAIRLLDRQPEKALAALDKAELTLGALPKEQADPARMREIALMRARAHSQNKNANKALALLAGLTPGSDVNSLKADIAWQAGYWEDAADALKDVIADQNISLTKPPTEEQGNMILNRAIALNLTGDRVALAGMRETYMDVMAQSKQARPFEVVTRPRQNATLADRQTLLDMVSEVDLFSEFLNGYKAEQQPSN